MKELITRYIELREKPGPNTIEENEFLNETALNIETMECCRKIRSRDWNYIPTVLLPGGMLPTRKHDDDLGLDIYATENYDLMPGQGNRFYTGLKMHLKDGGLLWDKSSSAWKDDQGRFVIVCGGAIDPAFRGEILVVLFNLGQTVFEIRQGKPFVQLITKGDPLEVTRLSETKRGERGFGNG